jgi:hypothetical protein
MQKGDNRALLVADIRAVARAEIDGFFAAGDACALAGPVCAALLRAWHALASWEAILRGDAVQSRTEFAETLSRGDRGRLPSPLGDVAGDLVSTVLASAQSDPTVLDSPPSQRQLDEHRPVLLRTWADLDRRSRQRFPSLGTPWRPAGAGVLVAATTMAVVFSLYRPRWRVSYYPNDSLSGDPAVVTSVLSPNRNWGPDGPGVGLPNDNFSAKFETCLHMKAPANVVFTMGSDDGTRLFVDDREVMSSWANQPYSEHRKSVPLDPGIHPVRLEYYEKTSEARLGFRAHIEPSTSDITPLLHLPRAKDGVCVP